MDDKPQRAKLHSKQVADEYVALGWRVTNEFWTAGYEEPYEIIVVWPGPGEPMWPEWMWRSENKQAAHALQQTAGACSVSGVHSSHGPRRC